MNLKNQKSIFSVEIITICIYQQATKDPVLLYLNERARSNDSRINFWPQTDGIEHIRDGNFAYLAESITAYNIIDKKFSNKEVCDLVELNAARPTLIYIVGKKNGEYNKLFSIR